MRRVFSYAATSLVSIAATLALVRFLDPEDHNTRTSYEELAHDVEAGRVDEIAIDGRTYRYRVRGVRDMRETQGPEPTLASVDALHPADSAAIPAKIRFVR